MFLLPVISSWHFGCGCRTGLQEYACLRTRTALKSRMELGVAICLKSQILGAHSR